MQRQSRKEEKSTLILNAAREVFARHGYQGASVDLIAAEAQVSKATVYAYFDNKEQLFARCMERHCVDQEKGFAEIEHGKLSTFEGLYKVADVIVEALNQPGALQFNRMMLGEAARFPLLGRTFAEGGPLRLMSIVAGIFESLDEQGELDVPDHDLAAEMFVGMLRSSIQVRSLMALGHPVPKRDLDKLVRCAVAFTLAALKPANPPSGD